MNEAPAETDIRIASDDWKAVDCAPLVAACFAAVGAIETGVASPVCVLFTDDQEMAALNSTFRGRDKPTNVLSFPAGAAAAPDHDYLGDIALGYETCRREADEKRIALRDHAAHLIVHGLLHLIGYDHENDAGAAQMERRETEILAAMGIADPYAAAMETS